MRDVFIRSLSARAKIDPSIFLITGDLGFSVLDDYSERYPTQFLNAGVAEQNMTALAAGLAREGRNVFTYSIANFPTLRCLEQIRNDICYHNANVTIVSIGGGFSYGGLGPSHHATEDIAILRSLPNMLVVVPSDKYETAEATQLVADHNGPAFLRLDKTALDNANIDGGSVAKGKARLVTSGDSITIFTTGGILKDVHIAYEKLKKLGIDIRIMTIPTVSHLDDEALKAACIETGGIVTVEEHSVNGGLGGAIAERCMDLGLSPSIFKRMGLPNRFVGEVGSQDYMKKVTGLDSDSIVTAISALLE